MRRPGQPGRPATRSRTTSLTGVGESRAGAPIEAGPPLSDSVLSQGASLAYFAGFAVLLLLVALYSAGRRDA
jgi:ABC-2 type transport system permease protein